MIALTQRLTQRDEQISILQEELEAYDSNLQCALLFAHDEFMHRCKGLAQQQALCLLAWQAHADLHCQSSLRGKRPV